MSKCAWCVGRGFVDCVTDGRDHTLPCRHCGATGEGANVDTVRILVERATRAERERDEARAALALAYPRALQAAAYVAERMADTRAHAGLAYSSCVRIAEDILALTPEDIERIAQEHEHG